MMKSRISSDVFLHVPNTAGTNTAITDTIGLLSAGSLEADEHGRGSTGNEAGFGNDSEKYIEVESEGEDKDEDEVDRYLIFFITGNPGLIGYYHLFLTQLVRGLGAGVRGVGGGARDLDEAIPDLNSARRDNKDLTGTEDETVPGSETGKATAKSRSSKRAEVVVFGSSLGGFEIDGDVDEDIDEGREKTDGRDVDDGGGDDKTQIGNNVDAHEAGKDHEDDDAEIENDLLFPTPSMKERRRSRDVVGLTAQVELCIARLKEVVRRMNMRAQNQSQHQNQSQSQNQSPQTSNIKKSSPDSRDSKTKGKIKVILIGHSVGAWIALEMIHQLHQLKNTIPSSTPPPSTTPNDNRTIQSSPSTPANATNTPQPNPFTITAALLLTPTILDLARSNTGRLAAPVMSGFLGGCLPSVAQYGAAALRWAGEERVRGFVGGVTGMGGRGGGDKRYFGRGGGEGIRRQEGGNGEGEGDGENDRENGLDVTMNFLMSANGVRQALSLAGEELKIITSDSWGEDVWGGSGANKGAGSPKNPKLYFLFAGKDHWVADETREKIIQRTGQPDLRGRHVLEIDEQLEHAWCLRQSGRVADKVGEWIEEIVEDGD